MPLCAQIILAFLTVVAVIMATQPFIHYWFGRPKIRIGFYVATSAVMGEIRNEPITGGLLKFLRISRDVAQDVAAYFTVSGDRANFSTPNTIQLTRAGITAERVSLPASSFPATFIIAVLNNKQVKLEGRIEPLPHGEYIIEVIVESEGTQYRSKMGLIVGEYPLAQLKELN